MQNAIFEGSGKACLTKKKKVSHKSQSISLLSQKKKYKLIEI